MKRRVGGRVDKPRVCAFCGNAIAAQNPPFLLSTVKGQVIGPYHAYCAERLALTHKGQAVKATDVCGELYGQLLLPREETLPW